MVKSSLSKSKRSLLAVDLCISIFSSYFLCPDHEYLLSITTMYIVRQRETAQQFAFNQQTQVTFQLDLEVICRAVSH